MPAQTVDQVALTLGKLRKARAEAVSLFDRIAAENDQAAARARRVSSNVDTAAFLAGMFASLGSLAVDAHKGLKLSGEALERHNKAVLSQVARDKSIRDGTLLANTLLDDVSQGSALLFGKAMLKAWNDMQSPSFWAGMYTEVVSNGRRTWDPVRWASFVENGRQRASGNIAATRARTLANIDRKIRRYEAILARMKRPAPAGLSPR